MPLLMTAGTAIAASDSAMSSGTVTKIDAKWNKITVDHGPLENLDMPAMKMVFVLADPAANAIAGAVLVFSFYVNGASFLAFAIMAEKHGLSTHQRGEKSFFFTTGLAEATETIAVFVLACLFPAWFPWLAWAFAAICLYTAVSRIVMTGRMLG